MKKDNCLSTKDLSYLADIFNWNLNCYNAYKHFEDEVDDENAQTLICNTADLHKNACEKILKIMG